MLRETARSLPNEYPVLVDPWCVGGSRGFGRSESANRLGDLSDTYHFSDLLVFIGLTIPRRIQEFVLTPRSLVLFSDWAGWRQQVN